MRPASSRSLIELEHVVCLLVDDPVELAHLGRLQFRRAAQESGGRSLDRGQRGSQLVAHHAQELGLQPLQLVQRRQVLHGGDRRNDRAVRGTGRREVDQHPHAATVGDRQHDLLGTHRLGVPQQQPQAKLVEGDLSPIGKPARYRLQQRARGPVTRRTQDVDNPARLLIQRHRPSVPDVEDRDTHWEGLDQGLQFGPGPLLAPVRASVGDRGCGLRRKQDEDLFVLARELRPSFLVAQEDVADVLAPMTHRCSLHRLRRQPVGREAERADVSRQVAQPQRSRQVAKLFEEPPPVAPVGDLPVLVGRKAGGDEVLDPLVFVDGRDHAISGAGQRAGTDDGLLQDGVQVEAVADAQNGLVQAGDAILSRLVLPRQCVGICQAPLPPLIDRVQQRLGPASRLGWRCGFEPRQH